MKNSFICATENYCKLYDHVSAPYIRKEFEVKKFSTAILRICGLGFYDLFVNGEKITKGKLAPYISNPDHLIYYDEYDVSALLKEGGNALGVILGNGFLNNMGGHPWGFDKANFRSAPMVSLLLEMDGKEVLRSDETFKTAPSPIYFDDLRCGEYYDANKEQSGWATYGFDDSTWGVTKKVSAPKGELVKAKMEPIIIRKEILPVSVIEADGGFIVDFGVNTAGICRIIFQGYKGQKITAWHGEVLLEDHSLYVKNTCTPDFDRSMTQKDIFICSGRKDVFEPSFTYHGFRYVFIEGIEFSRIDDFSITMLQLSSDLQATGTFSCSNDTVNKLQDITVNSDVSNFFYFPTDCPQREKNGWTGDAVLSCEQMLYNLDCANSLEVWLENIRRAQRENGQLPGVIPTDKFGYEWGGGPGWDAVIVELPYQIYRFTGKKKVLEDNVEAIAKYITFLQTKMNENGLIAFGLPDWCECGQLMEGLVSTPLEVTDTLISIEICQKAERIFNLLGKSEYEEMASNFANILKRNFQNIWVDENLFVKCNTQTAQAKAIDVGIFKAEEKKIAVQNLIELIEENDRRFKMGVIGARVLFRVLADNGYGDLALEMMTKDGFPSYKYWLDHGATSLWEGFNELYENSIFRKDGARVLSLNHHFWGDISAWFYRYILGININPNFDNCNEFEVSPVLLSEIETAKGGYIKNGNGISIERYKKDGKVHVKVETFGNAVYKLIGDYSEHIIIEK